MSSPLNCVHKIDYHNAHTQQRTAFWIWNNTTFPSLKQKLISAIALVHSDRALHTCFICSFNNNFFQGQLSGQSKEAITWLDFGMFDIRRRITVFCYLSQTINYCKKRAMIIWGSTIAVKCKLFSRSKTKGQFSFFYSFEVLLNVKFYLKHSLIWNLTFVTFLPCSFRFKRHTGPLYPIWHWIMAY